MLGAAALITHLCFVPRTALLWCGHLDTMRILPLPCKGPFPSGRAFGWHPGSPQNQLLGSESLQTNLPQDPSVSRPGEKGGRAHPSGSVWARRRDGCSGRAPEH